MQTLSWPVTAQHPFGQIASTNTGTRLATCFGPAFGYNPTLYRAESYGIISSITFIQQLTQFFKTDKIPPYTHYCNNENIISNITTRQKYDADYTNQSLTGRLGPPQWIQHNCPDHPRIHQSWTHQSHQDNKTPITDNTCRSTCCQRMSTRSLLKGIASYLYDKSPPTPAQFPAQYTTFINKQKPNRLTQSPSRPLVHPMGHIPTLIRSPTTWLDSIYKKIWSLWFDMWEDYNKDRYRHDSTTRKQAQHKQAIREIRLLYNLKSTTPTPKLHIFNTPLDTLLKKPTY